MIENIAIYLFFGLMWSLYWESFGPEEYPMNNSKRFRYIFFWPIGTSIWVIGFTIGFINHLIRIFRGEE
jgi:hypothetical protein